MAATVSRISTATDLLRSVSTAWDLLLAITARDLRVRYQGTLLSYVWWIARPLALGAVLYFALGQVLRLNIPNYSVFLMSALFPWFWFSGSIQQATETFVANGGLLKKVRFPRLILPLSAVLYNTIQFLLTLPILTMFVLIAGIDPTTAWIVGIPMLLAIQLFLLVGLGTLLASLQVFFRDIAPILDVALLLGFYVSPIIYPLERVPERFKPFLLINPVVPLLEGWRKIFLHGEVPGLELWPVLVFAVCTFGLGLVAFRSLEDHFADVI